MATIFVTIHETSLDLMIGALASLPEEVEAVEVRADAMDRRLNFEELAILCRSAKSGGRTALYTRRSVSGSAGSDPDDLDAAIRSGFDLVDCEMSAELTAEDVGRLGGHALVSYHDFASTPDLPSLISRMQNLGAPKMKIAVRPSGFRDNCRILGTLVDEGRNNLTLFGMGSMGLYSRLLAPAFGSELFFAARTWDSAAAPGQIPIDRCRDFPIRETPSFPRDLFAIVGNPAAHSLSPRIHNRIFRERNLPAVYSALETDQIEEVLEAMLEDAPFAPVGISITAPFKEKAFHFLEGHAIPLSDSARACKSVNTFVRMGDGSLATNTDLAGFDELLPRGGSSAAVIGAGGTARAALIALQQRGMTVTIFNRSGERADALAAELCCDSSELSKLTDFKGTLLVNTVPSSAGVNVPWDSLQLDTFMDASYTDRTLLDQAASRSIKVIDGMALLEAQARPQSELFLRAIEARAAHFQNAKETR